MNETFGIVHYAGLETEPFTESGIEHWKLTEPLGATEMRVNAVELDPGQALDPHAHEHREEIYVAMTDGQVDIEGDIHEVPEAASSASVPTRSGGRATTPTRPTSGSCLARRRSVPSWTSAST